jgi:hypothetical protein
MSGATGLANSSINAYNEAKEDKIMYDKAYEEAVNMAATLGKKPGTRDFDRAVETFIEGYLSGENVPYDIVAESTQKRGEK